MFENFTRTRNQNLRRAHRHGSTAAKARRCCCCTAIRSVICHGTNSRRGWREEFTVVATDLRGYGDSEKPPGGDNHANYSFRAMAQDQIEVMAALGYERFYAAGHDRGARVLHRMCLDHSDKVARAAILDIIPQHHLFNQHDQSLGDVLLALVLHDPACTIFPSS